MAPQKPIPKQQQQQQQASDYSSLKRTLTLHLGTGRKPAENAVLPLRKARPLCSLHIWPWRIMNKEDALRAGAGGQSVDKGVPPTWQNQDLFKELLLLLEMGPSQCLRSRFHWGLEPMIAIWLPFFSFLNGSHYCSYLVPAPLLYGVCVCVCVLLKEGEEDLSS